MTIERLYGVLSAIGAPPTARDLAELLWLACHVTTPERPEVASPTDAATPPLAGDQPRASLAPSERQQELSSAAEQVAETDLAGELHALRDEVQGSDASPVLVPSAPMLHDTLGLQRALRSTKRWIPSGRRYLLDEEATAERIAQRPSAWTPVLRPAPERWLSLALVVDSGPSMQIWRTLARELHETLVRVGSFRDLRLCYLAGSGVAFSPDGPPRIPASLVDPSGRQVVLVLSDCSGRNWWDGSAGQALQLWAQHGPIAIVQTLSERLWRRTAAPTVPGIGTTLRAGAPGCELRFAAYDGDPDPGSVPIPVLEISKRWFADWASLLTSTTGHGVPTAVTHVSLRPRRFDPLRQEQRLPVEERVRRFHAGASPEAAKLAAHVAVSVPKVAVMQLIQRRLLPGSQPGHLAEVILSGLLTLVDADQGLYDFIPGAREHLLATVSRSESQYAAYVLSQVSAEIEERAGSGAETFRAYLPVRDGTGDHALGPGEAFALVSSDALRMLNHTTIPTLTAGVSRRSVSARREQADTTEEIGVRKSIRSESIRTEPQPAEESFAGHSGVVWAMTSFSGADGRTLLATGSDDHTIRLWDLGTGRPVGEPWTDHDGTVRAITAFEDADGRTLLASGSDDHTIRLWEPNGTLLARLLGHVGTVRAVTAFVGPDRRTLLASASGDGTARIWDFTASATSSRVLNGHSGWVRAVAAFSDPCGSTVLATGSDDHTIRLWDPASATPIGDPMIGHTGSIRAVSPFTGPDGNILLATAGGDRTIRVWDPASATPIGDPMIGHTGSIRAVSPFTGPDGNILLASASNDHSVRIWDPVRGAQVGRPLLGHTGWVVALACVVRGGLPIAISSSTDQTIEMWDLVTSRPRSGPAPIDPIEMSPGPMTLPPAPPIFVGRQDDILILDNAYESGKNVFVLRGMPGIGKTALALHLAHRWAGRYPEGRLFLHAGRLSSEQIFEQLLAQLGMTQSDEEEAVPQWRNLTVGSRFLLVLDDVTSADQIRDLLLDSPDSITIITSRADHKLHTPRTCELELSTLSDEGASALFHSVAGRALAATDFGLVAKLTELTGGHPLALYLAGRLLRSVPNFSLADLIAELQRQGMLRINMDGSSLYDLFATHAGSLSENQKAIISLLGLQPSPEFGLAVIGATNGTPSDANEAALRGLVRAGFLVERPYDRFELPILLYDFAKEEADFLDPEVRERCTADVLHHYLSRALSAQAALRPARLVANIRETNPFSSGHEALTWLRQERTNLVACSKLSTRHPALHDYCWRIPSAIAYFLDLEDALAASVTLFKTALSAATVDGDRAAAAEMAAHLAESYSAAGDLSSAVLAFEDARERYGQIGDRIGIANTLARQGLSYYRANQAPVAARFLIEALTIYEGVNARPKIAAALVSIGDSLTQADQRERAIETLEKAAAVLQTLGESDDAVRVRIADLRHSTAIGANELTPIERRVAELAADGATNTRISAEMYLSIYSVERHLLRIYRKLGIDSRRELAAAISPER